MIPLNLLLEIKRVWIVIGVVVFILLATPILSTIIVFNFIDFLDCNLNASGPTECLYLGLNWGERLYGYMIPLIGSILSPIAFFSGFWDIFLIWVIVYILIRRRVKQTVGIMNEKP